MGNGFNEEGIRDGAITYFGEQRGNDLITLYLESKDETVKRNLTLLLNQKTGIMKKVISLIEEFNKIGSSPELEALEKQGEDILTGQKEKQDKTEENDVRK